MSNRITHDIKETCIEALKVHGTMQYAAEVCGVSVRTLNEEMRRSEVFKRRVLEAREEGKHNLGDKKIEFINDVAEGKIEVKMPQLTAALSIANWAVPGFRGDRTTTIRGQIEHDVRVITGVPRPKYDELPEPKKVKVIEITSGGKAEALKNERPPTPHSQYEIDKERLKRLNRGEPVDSVEEVIEGEVIKNEDKES